jgi:two-component system, NtrC family, response regulator AtoC
MEDSSEAWRVAVTPSEPAVQSDEEEASTSADRCYLIVLHGSASSLYPLPASGEVIIGRSGAADLQIDDAQVSRQHARLVLDGGAITIRDLGSQKGTRVNNVPLTDERALQPNDEIRIHRTTLVVHATPRAPAAHVLELGELRDRIGRDGSGSAGADRRFSLLCFLIPEIGERAAIQRTVIAQLRRDDAVAWSGERTMCVMLPGTSRDQAVAIATRIRGTLDRSGLRVGHVSCPGDGEDADALLEGVHAAAADAEAGQIGGPPPAFSTLTIAGQRVIIADPTVVRLYTLVDRLAPASIPVLIAGETGCGKELIATALHVRSHRAGHRLISLNCAALHEMLVESELFGHERGAFSGAIASKPGLIEVASGSTLFLDEIGELTAQNQAKLLRVLESHRVTRVGDVREREVDVRIVAATNRDLEADVIAGRFRRDLYFRLSAATLYLPPLRQRAHELPLLATMFLDDACRRAGRSPMRISDAAMAALRAHAWPGNVRELKNLMQYLAATLQADELRADHVGERLGRLWPSAAAPRQTSPSQQFRPLADELRELELTRIREALQATGGNQTRAAALLAMPVRTFFEKAKHYGLTPKKKRYDH